MSMEQLNLKLVLVAKHWFKSNEQGFGYLSGPDGHDKIQDPVSGAMKLKYHHRSSYKLEVRTKDNKYNAGLSEFHENIIIPANKEEALLLHAIVRNPAQALLNLKHPNTSIASLANLKLTLFPDIKIPIEHHWKNKIPKKHLLNKKVNWRDKQKTRNG